MGAIKTALKTVGSIIVAPFTPRSSPEKDVANSLVVTFYLARIGYSPTEAAAVMKKKPSAEMLQELLTKHQMSIPFENLGQLTHPGDATAPEVPACPPSLDVSKALKKIVFEKRGGFCFEINFAFAWLLRSLGFYVRSMHRGTHILGARPASHCAHCHPAHASARVRHEQSATRT